MKGQKMRKTKTVEEAEFFELFIEKYRKRINEVSIEIQEEILRECFEEISISDFDSIPQSNKALERVVTQYLNELGVPRHLRGFNYIRTGILLVLEDTEMMRITKRLYPKLAEIYETKPGRIERAIRHAIERTCENGNQKIIDEIFWHTNKERPTNSEFIAVLVDKIRLETK